MYSNDASDFHLLHFKLEMGAASDPPPPNKLEDTALF